VQALANDAPFLIPSLLCVAVRLTSCASRLHHGQNLKKENVNFQGDNFFGPDVRRSAKRKSRTEVLTLEA